MKMILMSLVLAASTSAFAMTNTNIELAGDCKSAIENAISKRMYQVQASIVDFKVLNDTTLLVRSVSAQNAQFRLPIATVQLSNMKSLARVQKVYVIQCDVRVLGMQQF